MISEVVLLTLSLIIFSRKLRNITEFIWSYQSFLSIQKSKFVSSYFFLFFFFLDIQPERLSKSIWPLSFWNESILFHIFDFYFISKLIHVFIFKNFTHFILNITNFFNINFLSLSIFLLWILQNFLIIELSKFKSIFDWSYSWTLCIITFLSLTLFPFGS